MANKIEQIKIESGITISRYIKYTIPSSANYLGATFTVPYSIDAGTLVGYTFLNTQFSGTLPPLTLIASDSQYVTFDLGDRTPSARFDTISDLEDVWIDMGFNNRNYSIIWNAFTGKCDVTECNITDVLSRWYIWYLVTR